jgi:oligopeptide transport system ATP-binding protein
MDGEELVPIPGTPPDLFAPPRGCAFADRCPYAMQICLERDPEFTPVTGTQAAACWLLHPDAPKVERPVEAGVKLEMSQRVDATTSSSQLNAEGGRHHG